MERDSRINNARAYDIKNEQIGTMGNLSKITQTFKANSQAKLIFHWEDRHGMLHSTQPDSLAMDQINELLKEFSPCAELPENLFIHVPQV